MVRRDSAGIQIVEAMRPFWGDSSLWSIDPDPLVDLALSGSGPSHEFYRAGSVKQRPDGSLVVADRGSREVRVFSATGEFQRSFGGRGDGPGEFQNLGRIESAGDTLLVLGAGRVIAVAPDLAVIRTFNLSRYALELHYLDAGTILPELSSPALPQDGASGLIRRAEPLALFDLEGTQIDSIGETRGADTYAYVNGETRAGAAPLFGGRSHIAALGQRIFRGSSDMMQVDELDMSGNLVRILRIPGYPLDLSDARIAAERDARLDELPPALPPYFREMVEAMPAPATRPAYSEMLVDPEGAIWLELYRGTSEREQPQEWLVLDADGTWLGTVEIPDRFRVWDITTETVLGVWQDEMDVDHPQVRRLQRAHRSTLTPA